MRIMQWLLIGSIVLGSGCTDPELAKKVDDLEKRVTDLEKGDPEGGPAARGKAPPNENEGPAAALLKDATDAADGLDYDQAKAKLAELNEKYPKTRAARAAQRLEQEIAVVGVDAGEFEVEKWFQGNPSMGGGKATLIVFWETWCPHCKREVPAMEETHKKFKDQGFQIVGLTKLTRNTTEEEVTKFIEENGVTYAMGKEKGDDLSQRFGVRGIPAAAVVQGGKIVWRGHPAKLTDQMIEGWIK